jgi:hypothetical protein
MLSDCSVCRPDRLDATVLATYGWPEKLMDGAMLALNPERAARGV